MAVREQCGRPPGTAAVVVKKSAACMAEEEEDPEEPPPAPAAPVSPPMSLLFCCHSNEAAGASTDAPTDVPDDEGEFLAHVPKGGKPGVVIRVQAPQNSRVYAVEIPDGATPGSTLAIALPEDEAAEVAFARIKELAPVDADAAWKDHADAGAHFRAPSDAHIEFKQEKKRARWAWCRCCCGVRRPTSASAPWRGSTAAR